MSLMMLRADPSRLQGLVLDAGGRAGGSLGGARGWVGGGGGGGGGEPYLLGHRDVGELEG